MSTFTISQQPDSTNLFLYPVSSASEGQTRFGESTNWECVDETWDSPDLTTYVYNQSTTSTYDMYNLTDHTTETGVINYVQIVNRATTNRYDQNRLGNYRIMIDVDSSSTYIGDDKTLTQSYEDYSEMHTSQPSNSEAWTWAAIDLLQSGVSASSPQISGASLNMQYVCVSDVSLGLLSYPNWADNTYPHFSKIAPGETSNGVGYKKGYDATQSYNADSFNTAPADSAASITSDIIQHIIISALIVPSIPAGTIKMNYKPSITLGGSTDYESVVTVGDFDDKGTTVYSTDAITSQPSDSSGWTAAAINQLILGAAMQIDYTGADNKWFFIQQMYFTVYYTENFTPEIRTTQSYAKVNYIPSPTTVTLTMPESLQVSHSRQISRYTFPSGQYEVDDYGRSGKTLTLSSTETSTTTATMQDLKDMCHYGAAITVAGLPDSNLNRDYHIVDFGFQQQGGEVDIYKWNLTLEED